MSLLLVPVLAHALSTAVSNRSEVRLRSDTTASRIDLVTRAQLDFKLVSPRARWGLTYAPALTEYAVGALDSNLVVMHSGIMRGNLRLSPKTILYFAESILYGRQNFRLLGLSAGTPTGPTSDSSTSNDPTLRDPNAVGGPTSVQAGALQQTIQYGSISSIVGMSHQLERRWVSISSLGYFQNQGLDATSRARFPSQRSAIANSALGHAASPRDQLLLAAEGQLAATGSTSAPGSTIVASIVGLRATWQRLLTTRTTGSLTAGAAYTQVTIDDSRQTSSVIPVGAASVRTRSGWQGGRISVGLSEQVSPFVDRLAGTIVPRAVTTLDGLWTKGRLSLGASGFATIGLGNQQTVRTLRSMFGVSEFASYEATRHWRFELGARQSWQSYVASSTFPMMWAVFAAASYTTGDLPL